MPVYLRGEWQFPLFDSAIYSRRNDVECFGDFIVIFRVNFDELQAAFLGEVCPLFDGHSPLIFKIVFVADQ